MERPGFVVPQVRTRQAMLADGVADGEIREALAAGTLVRVRRGCYLDGPVDQRTNPNAAVVARVGAVARQGYGAAVFSHATAAALWDLPFVGPPPETIHLTVRASAHGVRRSGLHLHASPLAREDVVEHRGIRLTSLPRTLVDVARIEGFRAGLVMADHALRLSEDPGALRSAIGAAVERLPASKGIRAARRMVAFADPLSGSPGESLSRIVLHEQGVPAPLLQLRFRLRLPGGGVGEFLTDFGWKAERVVGEFDGRKKYERYLSEGETPGDAVVREKLREEAIRDAGWLVVRWIWSDLDRPEALGRRLREILAARR